MLVAPLISVIERDIHTSDPSTVAYNIHSDAMCSALLIEQQGLTYLEQQCHDPILWCGSGWTNTL